MFNKHQGWIDDQAQVDRICGMLPNPRFQMVGYDENKDTHNHLLFKNYTGRWQTYVPQGIGDCVSFGFARLVDYNQVLDVFYDTNPQQDSDFEPAATEVIYAGSRVTIGGQHDYQDGSVGAWAAKWLHDLGTISREELKALGYAADYDPRRAKDWGYSGVPANVLDASRKRPFADVTLVTSVSQAASHIQSGRTVAVCSNVGFENGRFGNTERDSKGFALARGQWNHCMTFTSVKFGSRPGVLCENQWPDAAVTGSMGDVEIPPCSWWVDFDTADKMLKQNDSWTGSGYAGYPVRKMTFKH